jgi:hypothetical protein
VRIPEAAARR